MNLSGGGTGRDPPEIPAWGCLDSADRAMPLEQHREEGGSVLSTDRRTPIIIIDVISGSTLEAILKHRTDPSAARGWLLAIFDGPAVWPRRLHSPFVRRCLSAALLALRHGRPHPPRPGLTTQDKRFFPLTAQTHTC